MGGIVVDTVGLTIPGESHSFGSVEPHTRPPLYGWVKNSKTHSRIKIQNLINPTSEKGENTMAHKPQIPFFIFDYKNDTIKTDKYE